MSEPTTMLFHGHAQRRGTIYLVDYVLGKREMEAGPFQVLASGMLKRDPLRTSQGRNMFQL